MKKNSLKLLSLALVTLCLTAHSSVVAMGSDEEDYVFVELKPVTPYTPNRMATGKKVKETPAAGGSLEQAEQKIFQNSPGKTRYDKGGYVLVGEAPSDLGNSYYEVSSNNDQPFGREVRGVPLESVFVISADDEFQ